MERHRLRFKSAAVVMVFFLGLMACSGSRINQDNFDKIKTGMSLAEVRAILGEPADSSSIDAVVFSGASVIWKGEGITISIQFVNDKVIAKEFLKPGTEAPKPGQ
jgi:hypothetical protein